MSDFYFTDDTCLAKIGTMKQILTDEMCKRVCGNVESVDTQEAGEIIDMIKDLAAAQRYSAQAMYYDTVVEAMDKEWCERVGYTPDPDDGYFEDEYGAPMRDEMRRKHNDSNLSRMLRGIRSEEEFDPRYGKSFNEFRTAKRHYTENHSSTDKQAMDLHATEHVMDSMMTLREIWQDVDPTLRQKMKADLTKLVSELV